MRARMRGTYAPKPDVSCSESGCQYEAVEQDEYDEELCEEHLFDAQMSAWADREVKYAKENG